MTATIDYPIISGDSHFVEPPTMWAERIEAKFRDRAPRSLPGKDGGHYFVCEDIPREYVWVTSWFAAGKKSEELPEHFKKGWEAAPRSLQDPAERLKEQERDGVAAEVLYSTGGIYLYAVKDRELVMAAARAFNGWAAEYCSHARDRLLGVGIVILDDVPAAVKELERIAKLGLRGVMVPTTPLDDHPYSLPEYDSFWAAVQDHGLVVSMHAAAARAGVILSQKSQAIKRYLGIANAIQSALADVVVGGVFDRFPKLKIVSVEHDVAWFPHFLYRLDHGYERFRHLQGTALEMRPSDYLKKNVAATFQYDEGEGNIEFVRRSLGTQSMLWSSDYPHNDSTWPHSRDVIDQLAASIPPADLRKILNENVSRLYGIRLH